MKYIFVVICLSIISCSSTSRILTVENTMPVVQAPNATPLNLNSVKWRVITESDIKIIAAYLKQNPNKHIVFYTLDKNNYTALDMNLLDIKRYIEEQSQIILFYKQLEDGKIEDQATGQK